MTELIDEFYKYIDRSGADELEEFAKVKSGVIPEPAQGTNKLIDYIAIFSAVKKVLSEPENKSNRIEIGKFGTMREYGSALIESFRKEYPSHVFIHNIENGRGYIEVRMNTNWDDYMNIYRPGPDDQIVLKGDDHLKQYYSGTKPVKKKCVLM